MAKITPLFQNTDRDMKEYHGKLFRHRAKQGLKVLVCAVVVLGVIVGIWMWNQNKTWLTYEVTSSVERTDTVNTQYEDYQGKLLKYSRDGISCVNLKNEAAWSQTYNMQSPILDICGKSVVVADYQGNEAYIFNETGLQTRIDTLLPIQQVSISNQGVTALLLNDSSASWICMYDRDGKKLTESRCSLDETGHPLSISVSADGTKLAVSYFQVQSGAAASCVTFYNFGAVGGNFVDKIVASKIYEGRVIPKVKYLNDSICAVISDTGIIYYEGKEIPEEKNAVTAVSEIRSIFFGENAVGLVMEAGKESDSKYELQIYNTAGELILRQETNLSYSQITLSGEDLIVFSDNECEIYNMKGTLRYAGSFEGALAHIYKSAGLRKYVLVFSDRTEEIKLN